MTFIAIWALTAVLSAPISPVSATASPKVSNRTYATYSGIQYHVYANNIDYSKPVGAVYYLDGDYQGAAASQFHKPHGAILKTLAQNANKKNLILVAVNTPSAPNKVNGYTCWENGDYNATQLQSLALKLKQNYQLSSNHTYVAGYSGGAEVITYNLLTKDRSSWLQGGVIMIAGGGTLTNTAHGTKVTPHAKNKTIRATWYVGDNDKAGETNPPTWSAFSASLEGQAQYKKYGYTRAERIVLKNQGHHGYKLAGLISGRIYAVPAPKPAAKPKPQAEGQAQTEAKEDSDKTFRVE